MNYSLGYSWTCDELFLNFDSNKLKIDGISVERIYGDHHRKRIAARIFRESIKLIVNDIIENDVEFILPLNGSRKASLMMYTVKDKDFRDARKKHKFMEVDFLESNFTGNQIRFIMHGYNRTTRSKPVYLNKEYKQRITDYTNKQKTYCGFNKKTIKCYYDEIKKKFPIFPMQDIQRILNYAWKALYLVNSYGGDFLTSSNEFFFYMGSMQYDSLKHYEYYKIKLRNKIRIMFCRKKIEWDGYYYFALSKTQYENYLSQKKKRGRPRKHFEYGHVVFYKIFEDCNLANSSKNYFFRIPYPIDMGLTFSNKNLVTDKAEFYLERPFLTFKDILNNKSKII